MADNNSSKNKTPSEGPGPLTIFGLLLVISCALGFLGLGLYLNCRHMGHIAAIYIAGAALLGLHAAVSCCHYAWTQFHAGSIEKDGGASNGLTAGNDSGKGLPGPMDGRPGSSISGATADLPPPYYICELPPAYTAC